MRFHMCALAAAFSFAVASCGPQIEQSPEKQAVADQIHKRIMERYPRYLDESGVKVMAACLDWTTPEDINVSGLNWYYFETRSAARNRPVLKLKRSAIGQCIEDADPERPDCTCQVIDTLGRSALEVPDAHPQGTFKVSFYEPERKSLPPLPVPTKEELLEERAGGMADEHLPERLRR